MDRDEIRFHELKVFLEFSRHEHLGRAAEALDLSIPAVQRAVRSLEVTLGVPLVRRDGRRVRLLHAGRILADQAARVLRSRVEAIDAVLLAAGHDRLVLRLGYMYSLGLRVVPELVAGVLSLEPETRVELKHGPTNVLIDGLLAGELDAACVAPLPSEPELETMPLFTERYDLVMCARDPLARRKRVDLREVRERAFAALREGFGSRRYMLDACARAGFTPKIAFELDDIFTAEGVIGAGLAVSVLPARMADHRLDSIARIPLAEAVATRRTVGIAYPKVERRHRALAALLDVSQRFATRNDSEV